MGSFITKCCNWTFITCRLSIMTNEFLALLPVSSGSAPPASSMSVPQMKLKVEKWREISHVTFCGYLIGSLFITVIMTPQGLVIRVTFKQNQVTERKIYPSGRPMKYQCLNEGHYGGGVRNHTLVGTKRSPIGKL